MAFVGHDTAIYCETPSDFAGFFANGMIGTVETGAIIGWKAIRRLLPDAKFMAITRPLDEIRASLIRVGLSPIDGELEHRRAILDEMISTEKCPVVTFEDMARQETRASVFEYCLDRPLDPEWDAYLANENIQLDIAERVQTLIGNRDRIAAFKLAMNAE